MARVLKTYKTYNSTVRFTKYELYNKILGGITLLRVTSSVTWTSLSLSLSLYIYIYIYKQKERWQRFRIAVKFDKVNPNMQKVTLFQ